MNEPSPRRPRIGFAYARAAARAANRDRAVEDASPYGRKVGLCFVGDGVLDVPFFRPASQRSHVRENTRESYDVGRGNGHVES